MQIELAAIKAEKAAAEAAKQAEAAAKTGLAFGKTAFGLFGASKFGKMAMGAANQAAQAAKDVQQQRSSAATSRASSAMGGSRRQSTEESIDTEDEWYRHEIRELEQREYEKAIEAIKPSASINEKMNHVLIELSATVPRIEIEACQAFDREMKAKQAAFPPPRPTAESCGALRSLAEPVYTSTSEDEDHKKVIMRFQSSEDYDAEDSRDESSHAKRKGRKGQSESSENDSEATQSGPDSLMEDTGNSSDNFGLADQSGGDHKRHHHPKTASSKLLPRKESSTSAEATTTVSQKGATSASASGGGLNGSQGSLSSRQSRKSSPPSSGGSHKSQKSVKAAANGGDPKVTKVDGMPGPDTYDEEYDEDYYCGGYYDENGEWVEASGYYDENGDWVETGGYYDESGEWVEYAGYYDENGDWIDVEIPDKIPPQPGEEGYVDPYGDPDDPGGGEDAPEEPAGNNQQAGYFLANRGVAVFPQTQTAPRQKQLQAMESLEGTTTTQPSESLDHTDDRAEETEDTTEMGGDDEDEDYDDDPMDSGPDLDPDPGGGPKSSYTKSYSDHTLVDDDDDDDEEDQYPSNEISMGSGTQLKDQHPSKLNPQQITSNNYSNELKINGNSRNDHLYEDFEDEDIIEDEDEIGNMTNGHEPNLASIMAKREGKQGWNALRQTLRDRREDIFGDTVS